MSACCAECAASMPEAASTQGPGPSPAASAVPEIIQLNPRSDARTVRQRPKPRLSRSADREITFGGVIVAAVFLALAAGSLLLPTAARMGAWVPLHLALAGAATTAIAALLPFFAVTLAAARPAHPLVRIGGIVLVGAGAVGVIVVRDVSTGGPAGIVVAGGSFLAGLGCVAAAAFLPLRRALGVRRALVERAYIVALANVAVGATLAILMLAGDEAIGARWGALKPAHAWLNLVGFAGLVIVASVTHLAPTVAGGRIRPRRSSRVAVVGLAAGAPLVAIGYASEAGPIVQAGALIVIAAAIGLMVHAQDVHLDVTPGRWTTHHGWHRMSTLALLGGQAWIGIGLTLGASLAFIRGASPTGWSIAMLIGPLVIGGVVQTLIGAATHLVPAIGPGRPERHAAQREVLGRAATVRLVALNLGAALVTWGNLPGSSGIHVAGGAVAVGLAIASTAVAGTLVLLAVAGLPERVANARYVDRASESSGGG